MEDRDIEEIFKELFPELSNGIRRALSETLTKARYFISYQDLNRYIMTALENHVKLEDKDRVKLQKMLEKIYLTEQLDFPIKAEPTLADIRAINYATKLHDFYLGRFFQGDREIRLDITKWMSNYYLSKGYPIGKGQKGIEDFLSEFGQYLKKRTEWKARQIIDTSVNYLKNSARIKAIQKAQIKQYRWDATGDRLTCACCRSMDGRIFEVKEATRVLDMLEQSEDPELIRDLRPIQTTVQIGASSTLPVKTPPLHPNCRCRVMAYLKEEEAVYTTVERPAWAKDTPIQRELEEYFKSLTNEERLNRIKAHMGSDWLRPATGVEGVKAYEKAEKNMELHFRKHGKQLNYSNINEYAKGAYDIIKSPDMVFVEKVDSNTFYHFIKNNRIVISNDDDLCIQAFYHSNLEKWRNFKRDGIIRIL